MSEHPDDIAKKNKRLGAIVFIVVVGMIGMSFASVPLYRMFCQLTGFDGTTQVSQSAPDTKDILDRIVTIKFNTDVSRNLLWSFHSDRREVDIHLGQQGLITFSARNMNQVPTSAVAVYNVTPAKAGKYFHKIKCFCFGEQSLNPGEKATYPVVFYVDPAMDKDPNMQDVGTITLSYTFFHTDSTELQEAMEKFGDSAGPDPETSGTVALNPEKQ